jgi:hypothetical protein
MRSQKSRSRGNKNRNNNRTPQGNVVNRVFDSSGPEGKVRGTPQQIIDKYQQLHRDATLSNDRVAAENFAQHAEHYARMLGVAMREQEARQKAQEEQQRERQKERDEQHQAKQRQREEQQPRRDEAQTGDQPREQPKDQPREQRHDAETQPQPRLEEQSSPQPDVIDLDSSDGDSGLVETVENTPKPRKPRTRKPRVKPTEDAPATPPETDQSAAE